MLMLVSSNIGVNAMERNPAFFLAEDYVIIDYVKYNLVNNKVFYNGLEYELIDATLMAYDANGVPNVIVLPVEQNMIKDDERIRELNRSIGLNARGSVPTKTVPLPFSATVAKGGWFAQSPYVRVNLPEQEFMKFTYITISNMPVSARKDFKFSMVYCDVFGNWYDSEYWNRNLSVLNYIKIQNYTTLAYASFGIACLYGEPGFTYRITKGKI